VSSLSPIKAVLFDLDGTLIDTAPDFIRIIKILGEQSTIAIPSDELIRSQVSEGARAMVKLIRPDLDLDHSELLILRQRFLEIYAENIAIDTCLFPHMDTLLSSLEQRNIPWGIVTNKPRHLSELLLAALGLTDRCAVLVCPDDVSKTKPDPEPMLLAAKQLELAADAIVYVGDHPRDIDAGRAANMPTVLAAYGYLPPDHRDDLASWNADFIVNDVEALITLLNSAIHQPFTQEVV
jgi:2-phosphoglycolate phosphatase